MSGPTRRTAVASLGALVVAACSPFGGGGDPDPAATLRRYVQAWPAAGKALAGTVTGRDAAELIDALGALAADGVVRATAARVAEAPGGSGHLDAVVTLHFADGGRLETSIRGSVDGDRVRAEPAAVSTRLQGWARLHVEAFGAPRRGHVLSRSGTVLATGPEEARALARPGLGPAVTLIDEALDARLRATLGRRLVAGDPPRVLAESPPTDGDDVATSLDDEVQASGEKVAGDLPSALVAVDPRTGGIRALVSTPEPEAPDRSPATSPYSPGSAFKIVTAAAALEARVLGIADTVPCPARLSVGERFVTNFESLAYGPVTLEKAFAVSCNTAFAHIGQEVGTRRLLRTAERLGFRVVPELDGAGTIAVPLSRAELAVWSFGAAGSLVSPLQLAGIGATVAAGGTSVSPSWTDRAEPGRRVLRRSTAAAIVTMMEEVVSTGTGAGAAVPGAHVAGKTGTADPRRSGARSDGWFVGMVPARDSRLVAVGFVPARGLGGELAASLVRELFLATEVASRPQ